MSLFSQIIKQKAGGPPKGIIYGVPGCGKTTFGASSGGLILDVENGARHVECQRTPYLETWAEIEKWINALVTEKHDHKTVVIDTLDWLMRRLKEDVQGSLKNITATIHKAHGGYGSGPQVLENMIYQRLIPALDKLVNSGVAVILLCHARRADTTDEDGITLEKTVPELDDKNLNDVVLKVFRGWSDFIGLLRVQGNDRFIYLTDSPSAVGKNRYGITSPVKATWGDFINSLKGAKNNG